jgi:hypothetical protein
MKEIDFLPDWYTSGKRRRVNYRTQYILLGLVIGGMVVWNFITGGIISKVTAEISKSEAEMVQAEKLSQEYDRLSNELMQLNDKAKVIKEIDSRINVSDVLGEMSYLVGEQIVLNEVEFEAEPFAERQMGKNRQGVAARKAFAALRGKGMLLLGNVRFKVLIKGIASQAGDVASLICRLEESPYFCQVIPSFSKNKEIKPSQNQKQSYEVSEFEIICYLANYKVDKNCAVGQ